VSKRYALADTAQALNDMAERKVTGKVVIAP
jgi:NADPH:quinone reductase